MQELQKDEVPEMDEDSESETSEGTGNFVSRTIEKALDLPGVSFLKPSLSGLLRVLAANTLIALAAVAIPAALFLVLLSSLFGGKRASSVVRLLSLMPVSVVGSDSGLAYIGTSFHERPIVTWCIPREDHLPYSTLCMPVLASDVSSVSL